MFGPEIAVPFKDQLVMNAVRQRLVVLLEKMLLDIDGPFGSTPGQIERCVEENAPICEDSPLQ